MVARGAMWNPSVFSEHGEVDWEITKRQFVKKVPPRAQTPGLGFVQGLGSESLYSTVVLFSFLFFSFWRGGGAGVEPYNTRRYVVGYCVYLYNTQSCFSSFHGDDEDREIEAQWSVWEARLVLQDVHFRLWIHSYVWSL